MKNRILLALAVTGLIAAAAGPRPHAALAMMTRDDAASVDEAAVREAVGHYLRGHATGDPEAFRRAFHPEMRMQWVKDGVLQQRTAAEYIAGARGVPPADEAQRRRGIARVDVAGDAALATVVLDYPQARFTDYLSLLRVNGEWKVVAKVFHAEPRARP